MNSIAWKAIPLLFGSGLCALVYQVAWQRELRLVFGASTAASAAILAIFIGGMGIGSLLLGPRADRHARPLALYARLEMGIAVAAALSPFLLSLVRSIYFALGGHPTLGPVGATIARLVLTALVLAVPTLLMGGTLPAIARAVTSQKDKGRGAMALLYGINTLGAVAGSVLSTFAMLEVFGTRMTLWIAALVNLLVAIVGNVMARSLDPIPIDTSSESEETVEPTPSSEPVAPAWFVLVASGAVGFAFFLMELVWYRMLGPLLGGTVFTFGLILATALTGIGLGGAFYAILGRNRPARLHWFAITCIVEAIFIAIGWALGDRLALLALQLRALSVFGFGGYVAGWAVITGILILPAAFVSGVQFPMLIALLGRGRSQVGKHAGHAYAANTAGAMLGSLAGGFGLMPLLTAPGCWKLVVFLLVGIGIAAALLSAFREQRFLRASFPLALAVFGLLLLGAEGPTALWRHSAIGAGRAPHIETENDYRQWRNRVRANIAQEWEGIESSVALNAQNDVAFMVNGKSDGAALGDSPTQVMSGLLGALIHPEVKKGAVIGLGTGSTAGWLGKLPTLERLDVVEIEPVILEVARAFDPVNGGVLDNPKVHITVEDAREFLATTRERYDLIFSEPSNPYRAGIASLFTVEFYEAVAKRLEQNGVLLQWVQGYEIDARTLRLIYATLNQVFPYIETWELRTQDLLLIASREPIVHDVERMRARIQEEPFRSALANTIRVNDLEGVLGHFVATTEFTKHLLDGYDGPLNTDDLSPVEFGFAREVGAGASNLTYDMRWMAAQIGEHRPNLPAGSVDWEKVADAWSAFPLFVDELPPPPNQPTTPEQWRVLARYHFGQLNLEHVLRAWRQQNAAPTNPTDLEMLALALAEDGNDEALVHAEKLQKTFAPADVDAIVARLAFRKGQIDEAFHALSASLKRYRHDPWIHWASMYLALDLAEQLAYAEPKRMPEIMELLEKPFVLHRLDGRRDDLRLELSQLLDDPKACASVIEEQEPFVPWHSSFLTTRQACYHRAGHPLFEKAARELETFYAHESMRLADITLPLREKEEPRAQEEAESLE